MPSLHVRGKRNGAPTPPVVPAASPRQLRPPPSPIPEVLCDHQDNRDGDGGDCDGEPPSRDHRKVEGGAEEGCSGGPSGRRPDLRVKTAVTATAPARSSPSLSSAFLPPLPSLPSAPSLDTVDSFDTSVVDGDDDLDRVRHGVEGEGGDGGEDRDHDPSPRSRRGVRKRLRRKLRRSYVAGGRWSRQHRSSPQIEDVAAAAAVRTSSESAMSLEPSSIGDSVGAESEAVAGDDVDGAEVRDPNPPSDSDEERLHLERYEDDVLRATLSDDHEDRVGLDRRGSLRDLMHRSHRSEDDLLAILDGIYGEGSDRGANEEEECGRVDGGGEDEASHDHDDDDDDGGDVASDGANVRVDAANVANNHTDAAGTPRRSRWKRPKRRNSLPHSLPSATKMSLKRKVKRKWRRTAPVTVEHLCSDASRSSNPEEMADDFDAEAAAATGQAGDIASKCSSESTCTSSACSQTVASEGRVSAPSTTSQAKPSFTWSSSMPTYTGGGGGADGSCGSGRRPHVVGRKSSGGCSASGSVGGSGKKCRRVKPHSAYGKMYLTEEELIREMLRPSLRFERPTTAGALSGAKVSGKRPRKGSPIGGGRKESGFGDDGGTTGSSSVVTDDDGRIGTLSVEVLSCIGLPKFDRFYKPDFCAFLILGDSAFATDVIPSTLSPMWPCRSCRAVSFPIHHAFARLYVGVFGVTGGGKRKEKDRNDDFAGRVSIDLSFLRPRTEYDATLPLRSSTSVYDRRPRGAIRLRVRLEWKSERAAVLSYLRTPPRAPTAQPASESESAAAPQRGGGLGAGQLTIPCADAKTFRNVALTVHGEHLPGKYGRRAFRAATREAALYQVELRHVARVLANDVVTYERPLVSLYLFGAWMHCVYMNSVTLVPSYVVGYVLFLFMNNYVAFHLDPQRHGGYQSVSITEIVWALIADGDCNGRSRGFPFLKHEPSIRPLSVERRSQFSVSAGLAENLHSNEDSEAQANRQTGVDHAEFPFSERHAYPKSTIQDAIVPRSKAYSSTDKLSSRLTIYTDSLQGSINSQFTLEREWAESNGGNGVENDEEFIGGSDDDVDYDTDEDDEDEDDDCADALVSGTHRSLFVFSSDPSGRSIPAGPQQDVDILPKRRVPFKQNLAKFENRFHSLTLSLFDDRVFNAPNQQQRQSLPQQEGRSKKKEKKKVLDDFERRLGLRSGNQNPLVALTAGYLGPVMNMVRIWLSVVRVSFNVAAWTDPFLSFWVLCFLLLLAMIMVIFPWRGFFFISGIILVGPQNMILKRIARRKIRTCTPSDGIIAVDPKFTDLATANSVPEGDLDSIVVAGVDNTTKEQNRSRFPRITKKKKQVSKTIATTPVNHEPDDDPQRMPPAFGGQSGKSTQKPAKKSLAARSVVIPYSRLRKERFYDWPPDPNVSRALPLGSCLDDLVPEEIHTGKIDLATRRESGAVLRKRLYTR